MLCKPQFSFILQLFETELYTLNLAKNIYMLGGVYNCLMGKQFECKIPAQWLHGSVFWTGRVHIISH